MNSILRYLLLSSSLLVLTAPCGVEAATLPVALYHAEGSAVDDTGNHSATPAQMTYGPGKIGQAFGFTGPVNMFGSVHGTWIDFGNWWSYETFTVSLWMRDDATGQAPQTNSVAVMQLFDSGSGNVWSVTSTGTPGQYVYTGKDNVRVTFNITPGAWQQLTITRDGNTHVTNLYLNGQLAGSGTGGGNLFLDPSLIGGLRAGTDASLSSYWHGAIDELRIYDRVISDSEIAALQPDFDVVRDFISTTNASIQAWQYGYSTAITAGSLFTPYDSFTANRFPSIDQWYASNINADVPAVRHNTSGTTQSYLTIQQPADVLSLHPGQMGQFSVVRWSAPAPGSYHIQGRFQGLDSTTTDVHVVQNLASNSANELFTGAINGSGNQAPFAADFTTANAGDTIDFLVGYGSNHDDGFDSTGLVATISRVAPCAATPSGLLAWYSGDGTAADASGNAHGGTFQGNPAFVAGKVGQAFSFDGSSYVVIPSGFAPTGNAPRTVDFWFNAISTERDHEMFSYGASSDHQLFGVDVDGTTASGNLQLQVFTYRDDLSAIDTGLPPGQFMHVAVTYDGGTTIKVYINGTLKGTKTLSAPLNTTDTNVYIGRYVDSRFFTGAIDELDIFNRVLSDQEIQAIYAAGATGKCPTNNTPPSATLTFAENGPAAPGGGIHFTATLNNVSPTTGWSVRVQASTSSSTPIPEESWTTLSDSGQMTESPAGSGNYVVDSSAYPSGNVSFRAIASKQGQTDVKSVALGPFSLQQASLTVSANLTSTSDPVNGGVTHIGDDVTFTITFGNCGSAPAKNLQVSVLIPDYLDASTNLRHQFGATDIKSISAFGGISPDGTKIVWTVGDLAAPPSGQCLSNTVNFTVRISSAVRINQALRLNSYSVSSATTPPRPFGIVSGTPSNESNIEGPISFKIINRPNSVVPGGPLTYRFQLSNLSKQPINHPVAVVIEPQFTQFTGAAASYPTPAPAGRNTPHPAPPPTINCKHVYSTQSSSFSGQQANSQIVIDLTQAQGAGLYPQGDPQKRDSVFIDVTFQVQWADVADVAALNNNIAQIRIEQYDAAFLTDTGYVAFQQDFSKTPPVADFMQFARDVTNDVALAQDDSGAVTVPYSATQGTVDAGAPKLALSKNISNSRTGVVSDGIGESANVVQPGQRISFTLVAANNGSAAANNLYIQDNMPEHSSFVSATLQVPVDQPQRNSPPGSTAGIAIRSTPVSPSARSAGRTLDFDDLGTLQPGQWVAVVYTVQVNSGGGAPAAGTFINADDPNHNPESASSVGSSSTTHTPVGFFGSFGSGRANAAIEVIGEAKFAQPLLYKLTPKPAPTSDVSATRRTLDTLYNASLNAYEHAVPLTKANDRNSYIPGEQRFYIHYANVGTTTATGVKLDFTLPQNTVFYRAAFANLTNKAIPGVILPASGTKPGQGVEPPSDPSHPGIVRFTFDKLAPGAGDPTTPGEGDAMVEVIVTADAVQTNGSLIGASNKIALSMCDDTPNSCADYSQPAAGVLPAAVSLSNFGFGAGDTNSVTPNGLFGITFPWEKPHQAVATLKAIPVADAQHVPKLAIERFIRSNGDVLRPQDTVVAGSEFTVQFVIYNYGDTQARNPTVVFTIPTGCEYVDSTGIVAGVGHQDSIIVEGNLIDFFIDSMDPHSAGVLTVTLRATGDVGSSINFTNSADVAHTGFIFAKYLGDIFADPASLQIVAGIPGLQAPVTTHITNNGGPQLNHFIFNGGDVILIDIGGGNVIAQGGGNLIGQDGAGVIAQGGGNVIAQGGGNLVVGATNASALLTSQAGLIAQGGGNIIAAGGGNAIAQGGGNLVPSGMFGLGAGQLVSTNGGNVGGVSSVFLIAAGGGNLIAQGGGNLIAAGGGNLIAAGGGNIIAQGGGNLIAQGGGNIIAAGGGNVIAQGGGNLIAQGGGNILPSSPDSTASILTRSGNVIAAGGGNVIAQGGGN